MQYIWEVVLAAEKNGIREADLRYEVAEVRSPYLEVSFCDLNTQTVEQTVVEVSILPLFCSCPSSSPSMPDNERLYPQRFPLSFHIPFG